MATPKLVQWVNQMNLNNFGANIPAAGNAKFYLPRLSGGGNAIIVAGWYDTQNAGLQSTLTITDDGGNTYTSMSHQNDGSHGSWGFAFIALNVAVNTRRIQVQSSRALPIFQVGAWEFMNIATSSAFDVASTIQTGTSTSITAGSLTPTQTGDLLFQFTWEPLPKQMGGTAIAGYTKGSQANITWQLSSCDLRDCNATQWGVYSSTSAINSTMTQGSSLDFISFAVAVKASASIQGTDIPSGIQIFGIQHVSELFGAGATYDQQFPDNGNLLIFAYESGGDSLNSITTTGLTWTQCGPTDNGGFNLCQFYYAPNATPAGKRTLSIVQSATASDSNCLIIDVVGADSSPFDLYQVNHGTATGLGNISSVSITPGTANGLVLAGIAVDFNTVTAVNSPNALLNGYLSNFGPANSAFDQNNGYAFNLNPNTSSITFTWSFTGGIDANVGDWESRAVAFKAAPVAQPAIFPSDMTPGANIAWRLR